MRGCRAPRPRRGRGGPPGSDAARAEGCTAPSFDPPPGLRAPAGRTSRHVHSVGCSSTALSGGARGRPPSGPGSASRAPRSAAGLASVGPWAAASGCNSGRHWSAPGGRNRNRPWLGAGPHAAVAAAGAAAAAAGLGAAAAARSPMVRGRGQAAEGARSLGRPR